MRKIALLISVAALVVGCGPSEGSGGDAASLSHQFGSLVATSSRTGSGTASGVEGVLKGADHRVLATLSWRAHDGALEWSITGLENGRVYTGSATLGLDEANWFLYLRHGNVSGQTPKADLACMISRWLCCITSCDRLTYDWEETGCQHACMRDLENVR